MGYDRGAYAGRKVITKQKECLKEGSPKAYTAEQINHAIELLDDHSYNKVAAITGISNSTLIREVRKSKAI